MILEARAGVETGAGGEERRAGFSVVRGPIPPRLCPGHFLMISPLLPAQSPDAQEQQEQNGQEKEDEGPQAQEERLGTSLPLALYSHLNPANQEMTLESEHLGTSSMFRAREATEAGGSRRERLETEARTVREGGEEEGGSSRSREREEQLMKLTEAGNCWGREVH